MSNTGDKNKNHKPITITGNSSNGDLIILPNVFDGNTAIGYDAMYTNTTRSANIAIGSNALHCGGMTEEKAIEHMKSLDVDVKLKDEVHVTISIYEYMTIKNLVNNEDKDISDLTKEDFDVYLVTIRV